MNFENNAQYDGVDARFTFCSHDIFVCKMHVIM